MDDQEGATAPESDTQPTGAAKTATGDEAVLDELEAELTESDETDPGVDDDQPADGESDDEEYEEFEDGGRKAKIPKWLKPHLERNADYTRKTQAHAAQVKAYEAQVNEFKESQKFHQENVVTVAKIVNLDEQLTALRGITEQQWAAMSVEDRTNLQTKFTLLKDQRERVVGELQQKQQQALEKQRGEHAKQYEEGLARIAKKIPGWNDELAGKLNAYAVENGFALDELQSFIPRKNADAYVDTLRKAMLFDQLMARTRAKAKQPAPPVIEPVPTVRPRRSPASAMPSDSDDTETWIRKERNRVAKMSGARA
jgi:hypothetical protein